MVRAVDKADAMLTLSSALIVICVFSVFFCVCVVFLYSFLLQYFDAVG